MVVLKVLIENRRALHLREIAAAAGMAPSNVYRYLVSFVEAGMVSQDPATAQYDIGPLAVELGLAALRRMDPIEAGVEALSRLIYELQLDGHLCVFGSAGPTVVRWKGRPDLAVRVQEGVVLPILSSATGRTWAAFHATERSKALQARDIKRIGARTGEAPKAIQREIDEKLASIRATGVSWSSGELRPGIDALCAPVFDRDGLMTVSLTLLAPTAGFDPRLDGAPVARLRAGCEEISRRLGCGATELLRYPWRAASA